MTDMRAALFAAAKIGASMSENPSPPERDIVDRYELHNQGTDAIDCQYSIFRDNAVWVQFNAFDISDARELVAKLNECDQLRRDLLAARTAIWTEIGPATDRNRKAILYSPPENLSHDPKQEHDIRVARPNDFTWATHYIPLETIGVPIPNRPDQSDKT